MRWRFKIDIYLPHTHLPIPALLTISISPPPTSAIPQHRTTRHHTGPLGLSPSRPLPQDAAQVRHPRSETRRSQRTETWRVFSESSHHKGDAVARSSPRALHSTVIATAGLATCARSGMSQILLATGTASYPGAAAKPATTSAGKFRESDDRSAGAAMFSRSLLVTSFTPSRLSLVDASPI